MKRMLYRMVLSDEGQVSTPPTRVQICAYNPQGHHDLIPSVYALSFAEPPWPADWEAFAEFDPNGAFVAQDVKTAQVIGFVVSFRRNDHGYISVVAVVPEYHRQGIGSALVSAAIAYLRGLGLYTIRIDAFVDAPPAFNLYRKLGFQVEKTFEDEDGD